MDSLKSSARQTRGYVLILLACLVVALLPRCDGAAIHTHLTEMEATR